MVGLAGLFVQDNKIESINIDCTIREDHSVSCIIPKHPGANAQDLADQIKRQSREVRLQGIITKKPLAITSLLKPQYDTAFNKLQEFVDKEQPITLLTSFKQYVGVGIKSLTITRDPDTGFAVAFNITCTEMITPQRASTLAQSVADQLADDLNAGSQSAITVNDPSALPTTG